MDTNTALIIDDNATIRELLRQTLKLLGFSHIVDADTGHQGLLQLENQNYDVIFLDLELPDIHGTKLLHQLKAQAPTSPVVVVTAHNTVENLKFSVQAGAAGFIAKPFSAGKIQSILQKNLSNTPRPATAKGFGWASRS
ncbi:response regulator [Alkalimonas mucilaginosa]|uniref:Response regulator n=1 Tax=Alkalimonas mucilaginosa TaxID=3057676 RepID=A0ABU7JAS4_9GAMM|nr:response regulator [Alkalimonas sp. MEB004]MEE2022797.1 response regulator [Alkalimonas sp. MEB004]